MQSDKLASIINEVEAEQDKPYTEREKSYALHLATTGNQSEAAKAAGYGGEHVRQQGHKMSKDPRIQALVESVQQYSTDIITDDFIKQGLLKEAMEADNSRDRREALHLIAKTRGMMRDVVEQTNVTKLTDEEYLDKVEQQLGKEARQRAAEELGIDG